MPGLVPGIVVLHTLAMSTAVSPLAPQHVPDLPAIAGVRLATAQAGIRYAGRTDVLLTLFTPGTTTAGVFTKSKCPSAPVEWCRAILKSGKARALVVTKLRAEAKIEKFYKTETPAAPADPAKPAEPAKK